ncbi:hypothetical protein GCM10022246_02450 [Pedobacter ginsengiterrae]|uniref:Uncharacterized protein n=1 Tax=Pedobacter ginsengiterrae TaxID=871696 RepID=A0ABP7NPL6_9SPHI
MAIKPQRTTKSAFNLDVKHPNFQIFPSFKHKNALDYTWLKPQIYNLFNRGVNTIWLFYYPF